MPPVLTPILSPDERTWIDTWRTFRKYCEQAKADEMKCRLHVVENILRPITTEGTTHYNIGGLPLTLKQSVNYNAKGETEIQALRAVLPSHLSDLFRFKPEVSVSTYKKLLLPYLRDHAEIQAMVVAAIEIKPGTPSLVEE